MTKRSNRIVWTREWILRRENQGAFRQLMNKLRLCDVSSYQNFVRISLDLHSVIKFLQELSHAQRSLLSEVCTLALLILVMPATNAVSDRSFSALRCLKSYLRATMTQTRLNNVLVLYVHNILTD